PVPLPAGCLRVPPAAAGSPPPTPTDRRARRADGRPFADRLLRLPRPRHRGRAATTAPPPGAGPPRSPRRPDPAIRPAAAPGRRRVAQVGTGPGRPRGNAQRRAAGRGGRRRPTATPAVSSAGPAGAPLRGGRSPSGFAAPRRGHARRPPPRRNLPLHGE